VQFKIEPSPPSANRPAATTRGAAEADEPERKLLKEIMCLYLQRGQRGHFKGSPISQTRKNAAADGVVDRTSVNSKPLLQPTVRTDGSVKRMLASTDGKLTTASKLPLRAGTNAPSSLRKTRQCSDENCRRSPTNFHFAHGESDATCYECGERGHFGGSRKCGKRITNARGEADAVCYKCRAPGHNEDTCPDDSQAVDGEENGWPRRRSYDDLWKTQQCKYNARSNCQYEAADCWWAHGEADATCYDCGKRGHFAGSPLCR